MTDNSTIGRSWANASRPAAADPLLDISTTYDHENPITARVYRYPDGTIEMGYTSSKNTKKRRKSLLSASQLEERGHHHKTLARAKTQVRRLTQALPGRTFLTLTYADNQTCYKTAKKDLQTFIRRAKRRFGQFPFIAVAEQQKRGAWHWHILLDRFYDYRDIRKVWPHGFVDIRKVNNPKKAANYIGKYLTKTFENDWPPQEPRYLRSRGINLVTESLTFKSTTHAKQYFYRLCGGVYSAEWEKEGNGFITT